MTSNAHTHPPYIRIWLILLAALAGSLVLGIWAGSKVMIAIIFAVAIVKAFLVVSYYMHMKFAPRWLRLVAVSAVVVVAICYFGLLPDIQWGYATLSADEMKTIANGANATASSGEDTETGASATDVIFDRGARSVRDSFMLMWRIGPIRGVMLTLLS